MKSPGARTRGKQAAAAITPRVDFGKELAGMFDLEGRVALLPGGYGGIGEAIAWALARHGATVLIAGRSSGLPVTARKERLSTPSIYATSSVWSTRSPRATAPSTSWSIASARRSSSRSAA